MRCKETHITDFLHVACCIRCLLEMHVFITVQGNFSQTEKKFKELKIGSVWGLFMDVGLSSNLLINRGSRQRSPGGARRR